MHALLFALLLTTAAVQADIYLHNARGSNNRLNEKTAARANNNRLFNSQNNNRGGYNVGDAGSTPAGDDENKQYQMKYFQSSATNADSLLMVEWTMQHGCGYNPDAKNRLEVRCNVVLQYMCQEPELLQDQSQRIRDGTSTRAQDFTRRPAANETEEEATQRKNGDVKQDRGIQEPWQWYDKCAIRDRNKGLFTAKQKLGNSATSTRQNANGARSGYECPEERDYHPYWHPNPWKDIAVLTSDTNDCKRIISGSFNIKPRHECIELYPGTNRRKHASKWNNQRECVANGGVWTELHNYLEKAPAFKDQASCVQQRAPHGTQYTWAIPYDGDGRSSECLIPLPPPECRDAPWTRANHLGNTIDAIPVTFKWRLPYFPSNQKRSCVLRARYNISTFDYDPLTTDAKFNGGKTPIRQNPKVNVGENGAKDQLLLQLTMNENQYGRTFQDRTHMFWLVPRPAGLQTQIIHNLNVRGKRGNIVQVFPAVEYDFVPQQLSIKQEDLVHIQWTGSNTHNNNGAGSDGQGKAGTDRSNVVEIARLGENFPLKFDNTKLWNSTVVWTSFGKQILSPASLALNLVSAGFYRCYSTAECPEPENSKYIFENKTQVLDGLLNNAPASFEGVVVQMQRGVYHIMSTRNNNFSNRSQKRTIFVGCRNMSNSNPTC